jgi:hypothetical protein
MLLACAAIGSFGLLLGLWLRWPAAAAASGVTAAVCLLVGPFAAPGTSSAFAVSLTLVSVLQIGYLAGLMLSSLRMARSTRFNAWLTRGDWMLTRLDHGRRKSA